jgi:hypothetical protein
MPCVTFLEARFPYAVGKVVTKAASTSETPQPTRTPSGSQVAVKSVFGGVANPFFPMEHNVALDNTESTGRACVYCGQRGNLTNEHVVPDFYHKTFGETISIVKTPSGDKAIPSPQEIGDVCANCNNGALSRLDSHLADLTKKYFSTIVKPGDRIQFAYDSDLLLRTMLKVAYNVARTRNWHYAVHRIMPIMRRASLCRVRQCSRG